jgi:hypothetical protein
MIRPDFDRTNFEAGRTGPDKFRSWPDRTRQILKLAGPDRLQKIRPVPTLVRYLYFDSKENMHFLLFKVI